jgi:hypothetical protein
MLRCCLLFLLLLVWVPPAYAFPAFTRQTGAACGVCHFQDMRSLNAYGREFLRNSFRETPKMLQQRLELEKKQARRSGQPGTQKKQ